MVDATVDHRAARVVAFHLPQFHPDPHNDLWWGRGFTEWTNVAKARPRFPGHEQPHLPTDLGFYDLRLPEARMAQSELAVQYGVDAFMYYHYWFSGEQILERPVDDMVRLDEPGLPFALCWANESWTRRWDGSDYEVLIEQRYSREDDLRHIRALAPTLGASRYMRIGTGRGQALLAVYRIGRMPDPRRTADIWREEADRLGVGPLFLVATDAHAPLDPRDIGFDGLIEFHPADRFLRTRAVLPTGQRLRNRVRSRQHPSRSVDLFDYRSLVQLASSQGRDEFVRFPGVTPRWDNAARRAAWPRVLLGSTPELYEAWLAAALARPMAEVPEKLVFINAWNEWAEGNHLEPDDRYGHAYLAATLRAVNAHRGLS